MTVLARISLGAAACLLAASPALAQRDGVPNVRGDNWFLTQGPGSHIGVTVRDVDPTDANASAGGVVVTAVSPNSPAAAAGIQTSDVVVEFDGERVRSARQFARLVQETPPGRQVRTTVLRGGQRQELTITPADSAPRTFLDRNQFDDLVRRLPDNVPAMPQLRLFPGTPRLGVTVQDMTPDLATYFGANEGVLVSSVTDDSAAARAGLQVGDVITSAGAQRVRSHTDLNQALRTATGSITLEIIRDKKPLSVTVPIAAPATTRIIRGQVI